MTDLHARIREWLDANNDAEWTDDLKPFNAIRAVLDRHPEGKVRRAPYMAEESICETCSVGNGLFAYPCTTVRTIARELGVNTDD